MSVDTTNSLYAAVRARLLARAGVTALVGSGATARVLADDPGDLSAAFSGTKILVRVEDYGTVGWGSGLRSEPQVELTIFGRGNGAAANVRTLGDEAEAALVAGFTDATGGIVFGFRLLSRIPLPPGSGDVDRAVAQLTLRLSAVLWKARNAS